TGLVEALGVALDDTVPRPLRLAIRADRIVLATGSIQLLPVFPGNRLPGVVLSSAAWSLAQRFALWPGATALLHSSATAPYRMALLAHACGMTVTQASDPRIAPQSRFIEFCKAYGLKLRWGAGVARIARADGALRVVHRELQSGAPDPRPETVQSAIVSGGFAPDLTLWVAAGGAVVASPDGGCAAGPGTLEGVALAGAAAGLASHRGAIESGRAAVARLFGETPDPVSDVVLDPVFETPQSLAPAPPPAR